MEIVKNLQRLQGIDGDYDNDSGSGPDRIARRKTIQNLEKARQPRRQIGTLDVAFKKRFLKLTAANEENNVGTPILTRRMTMRAETIRALEVRKNSVMAEKRKSQMQTLGANNEYGITGNVSRVHFWTLSINFINFTVIKCKFVRTNIYFSTITISNCQVVQYVVQMPG